MSTIPVLPRLPLRPLGGPCRPFTFNPADPVQASYDIINTRTLAKEVEIAYTGDLPKYFYQPLKAVENVYYAILPHRFHAPEVETITVAKIREPSKYRGELVIEQVFDYPITLQTKLYYPWFGFGSTQGLLRIDGLRAQILVAFRTQQTRNFPITWVALWTTTSNIALTAQEIRQCSKRIETRQPFVTESVCSPLVIYKYADL